jgi:hypothetical protein
VDVVRPATETNVGIPSVTALDRRRRAALSAILGWVEDRIDPGWRGGIREEPVSKLRKHATGSNLVDTGRDAVHDYLLWMVDSEADSSGRWGGHGEGLRRRRGDTAGAKLGATLIDRFTVNTGTIPHRSRRSESIRVGGKTRRPSKAQPSGRGRLRRPAVGTAKPGSVVHTRVTPDLSDWFPLTSVSNG